MSVDKIQGTGSSILSSWRLSLSRERARARPRGVRPALYYSSTVCLSIV